MISKIDASYNLINLQHAHAPENDYHGEFLRNLLIQADTKILSNQLKACKFKYNDASFIVSLDSNNNYYLIFKILKSDPDKAIRKVQKINCTEEYALKISDNAKEEYNTLQLLNQNGSVWGIQEAALFQIFKKEKISGFLGVLYDMDYKVYSKVNPMKDTNAFYNEAFQILSGVKFLQDNQMAHLDIKSTNILVRLKNGDPEFKLADMEGVTRSDSPKLKTITKSYLLFKDFISFHLKLEKPLSTQARKDIYQLDQGDKIDLFYLNNLKPFDILSGIDLFQTGHLLHERLTKRRPYLIYNNAFTSESMSEIVPTTLPEADGFLSSQRTPSSKNNYPDWLSETFQTLIEEMLDHRVECRPPILEIFEILHSFLTESHELIQLSQKIQTKIKSHFPGTERKLVLS